MAFTMLCGNALLKLSNMLDKKVTKKKTTCPLCHGVFEQAIALQGTDGVSFTEPGPQGQNIQSLCPWKMDK